MGDVGSLFTRAGAVEEHQVDEEFLDHLAERSTYRKHQVTVAEILEVHAGETAYFANSSTGRAPVIMVGPTGAGRWLCVPVEPTGRKGVWRPVTAFEANTHHNERYNRRTVR